MKKLIIKNTSYIAVEKSFSQWLDTLGYARHSLYTMPIYVHEFFYYLEKEYPNLKLRELSNEHVNKYYLQLQNRQNERYKSGTLSCSSLNKHQQALKLFFQYLRQSGRIILAGIELRNEVVENPPIEVLSQEEVKELFQTPYRITYKTGEEHLRERDRAMLVIFYGCGLRRNEVVHLNVSDVDFERKSLKVRKGKNYKQRLVPLHSSYLSILQIYIFDSRSKLIKPTKEKKEQALFLSVRGTRMVDQSLSIRLRKMLEKTQIDKHITLHTLRHSVATHLLQQGMSLEQIAKFLGHSSLESTQIYTHLAEEQPPT